MKTEGLYLGSKFFFSDFTISLWDRNTATGIYEPIKTEYKFLEYKIKERSSITLNSYIMTSNAPFFSSLNFSMYINNAPLLTVEILPLAQRFEAGTIVSFTVQHPKLGYIEPNPLNNPEIEIIEPLYFTFHSHGVIQYE